MVRVSRDCCCVLTHVSAVLRPHHMEDTSAHANQHTRAHVGVTVTVCAARQRYTTHEAQERGVMLGTYTCRRLGPGPARP